jgi:hypothetical protein
VGGHREEGDRESDGAVFPARPADFDDSQTARVGGAAIPLLRMRVSSSLVAQTAMVGAEDDRMEVRI